MGPTHALVQLAEQEGFSPFIEDVEASERTQLVAFDLRDDGSATFRTLPDKSRVRGFPCYQRSGDTFRPRPFRDDSAYTLGIPAEHDLKTKSPKQAESAREKGARRRAAYAEVVDRIAAAHPRTEGLQAFQKFMGRKPRCPKWLSDLTAKSSPLFIPFYKGKPVFESVAADLADSDPYSREPDESEQHELTDVITGELSIPTKNVPKRIRGLGASSGTTLMSTNEAVTHHHGYVSRDVRHLRAPMSDRTLNLHVDGLQWLVERGKALILGRGDPKKSNDGRIKVFFWCASGEHGPADLFYETLMKGIELDKLQEQIEEIGPRPDNLCCMGIREGKRIQYVAWHYVPLHEALHGLLEYGRRHVGRSGKIWTFNDVARACVPLGTLSPTEYDFKVVNERAAEWCSTSFMLALLDHIVDGHPFPYGLTTKIRLAFAMQPISEDLPSAHRRHLSIQQSLAEQTP